uniref:Ig-like domain-containing protein n=1 Tax=uncultured Sulfitobacter sp. TaxID=191468 RepID=UPI002611FB06
YTISDGNGGTDDAVVTVQVNAVNDPPVAEDDSDATDEDTLVTIDVLGNDVDVDGDDLTVTAATSDDGTVVINGNGTLDFTPDPDFNGEATISYTISDGNGGTDDAVVTVQVNAVNDPPVAEDDAAETDEDMAVTISVLANDSDPELDPLTVTGATSDDGTVVINDDGTITFTPNLDFNGEATINYTIADDNGGEDDAVVNVTVNAVNDILAVDDTAETDEDTPVTIDVLANDEDADGDDLTVTAAASEQGVVEINDDGTITFTPTLNFNGEATINYTIEDGQGGLDSAVVTVDVGPLNDAPVATDDVETTPEETPVTIDILVNDTDPDGDPLTITEATSDDGTVEINDNGTITFTPSLDFFGEAVIDYTISDGNGGIDDSQVFVTVTNINDAPVAVDDVAATDEDISVTISVLDNDSDPDSDPLTVTAATSDDGTVTINDNGTIEFTPNPDFNGDAVINYTISDNNGGFDDAVVTVSVGEVSDPPVAADDEAITDEDTPVTITVLGNDTDPDGDDLTVTEASSDDGNVTINDDGTLEFTPNEDFNGETTIAYTITDGNGGFDEAVVTVTVNPVNDGPLAEDDEATTDEATPVTISVLDNDSDPEGDPLTVVAATSPNGDVVINDDGTLTFTPDDDFTGEAVVNYVISDGDLEDPAVVFITVNPEPSGFAPVAVDDTAETLEETPVTIDVLANDTDPEDDPLTITEASSDDGTVVINDDGTITFTPDLDFFGDAVIDYTVTDGNGGFDDARVNVTVENLNDAPIAVDDCVSTPEDTPVTIPVLANDSDPDGNPLTVIAATSPDGDVVINDDGTVTFTPNPDFTGDAEIAYTISDGNGETDEAIAKVSVGEETDPPVANDDTAETDEDTPVTIDVLGNDTDPDGDPLEVISATSPDGTVTINDDGTIEFTPNPDFNGPTTITYTVTDGNGGEDTGTVDVTVNPVNDGPLAEDDVANVNAGSSVTVPVLANDSDPENDPLTIVSASSPDGEVVINDDGTLTFTPNEGFVGEAQVNYTVSDGELEDPAVLFVTVADGIVTGTDGDDLIDVDYVGDPEGDLVDNNDEFLPGEGPNDDIINAGDGNDTVLAGEGDDDVSGGAGDDSIDGGIGDDELDGDEGDDTLIGGAGDDTLNGGEGDDDLNGGEGDDVLNGGEGDDDLIGADGDDTISGGDGNDTVEGNEGDDVIDTGGNSPLPDIGYPGVFPADPNPDDDRDSVDGGDGNDTISTGDDADTINGGAGDDVISGGIDDDEVDGGEGDDRIVGAEGNDTIQGGEGNDTIYANNDPDLGLDAFEIEDDGSNPLGPDLAPDNGDDFVDGGAGDDVIFGGDDNDTLLGGIGDDLLDGGIDDDTLRGGAGNDTLIGGQGDDSLEGNEGDDTLEGDIGDDTLRGNIGSDTIHGGAGNDLLDGGADNDVLSGDEGDDTLLGALGDDTLDGGVGDDSLDGGAGDDTLEGGEGDDTLRGATGDDSLHGGEGDDLLDGGQGDDVLSGDEGDDTLEGALGDDTLEGGEGDDVLLGGSGDDLLLGNAGNDTMTGGNDRDIFRDVNAGDIVDGSEGGDDFDCLELAGSAPEGGRFEVTYDPDNGENGVVDYFNEDGSDAGQLVFTNIEKVVVCFTPGTMIATPKGERKVEGLKVGDRIITRDNGMQEIRWIGHRPMSGEELVANEHLRPILIQQGALGNGLPERDMMVSPQHRVLIANDKTALYFEEREVLVAAKHLTDMEGIDQVDVSHTTYIHIMFDQHEVILSDGTWTESFQPGDNSLAGVGDAARDEILELFPELATREGIDAYAAARKSLKKHEAKLITKKS